jgi:hypothetical protein
MEMLATKVDRMTDEEGQVNAIWVLAMIAIAIIVFLIMWVLLIK